MKNMAMKTRFFCATIALGCLLSTAVNAQGCPSTTETAAKYLNASDLTVGKALAPLLSQGDAFRGTVFVPSNQALNATLTAVLGLVSAEAKQTVTGLPPGYTLDSLFALPAFQDVLKLHIVPTAVIDPTQLVAANFTSGKFSATKIPTLLTPQATPNFCTSADPSTATLSATVTGTSGANITGAVITAPGGAANVTNATVSGICDIAVVHVIDAILLPCDIADSAIPSLAKSLAAAVANATSPSPAMGSSPSPMPSSGNTSTNTTSGSHHTAASWMVLLSGVFVGFLL